MGGSSSILVREANISCLDTFHLIPCTKGGGVMNPWTIIIPFGFAGVCAVLLVINRIMLNRTLKKIKDKAGE